jgi:mono/diheme cytochrome c family protein
MTPFGASMTDDQIASVLTYIRQSSDWGNNASEVTPEMVKTVREKTASRTTPWTADELLKIPVTE